MEASARGRQGHSLTLPASYQKHFFVSFVGSSLTTIPRRNGRLALQSLVSLELRGLLERAPTNERAFTECTDTTSLCAYMRARFMQESTQFAAIIKMAYSLWLKPPIPSPVHTFSTEQIKR